MTVTPLLPPALRPGDAIGVIAPSDPDAAHHPGRFERGLRDLADLGYQPRAAPHARAAEGYASASGQARAADIHAMCLDPDVRLIMSAIGGHTAIEVLEHLDYDLIASNPTIIMGYSDATALLIAVWQRTGLRCVMGPQLLPQFGECGGPLPYTASSMVRTLANPEPVGVVDPAPMWTDEFLAWEIDDTRPKRQTHNPGPVAVAHGRGAGPAVGANLETLLHLAGTPYWPDLSGHVLLLEATVPTRLSVLARDLAQLRLTDRARQALGEAAAGGGEPAERPGQALLDLLAHRCRQLAPPQARLPALIAGTRRLRPPDRGW